jgi:asparagine synthase (glutamine-hydrolysing)
MCGIAGFFHNHLGSPADRQVIEAMTAQLEHRGPDEAGYYVDGGVALGSRRLRVVDLEGGRQPMGNEDGSVQVVFNGEIYNHAVLRMRLEACGHRFRTRSDTEVIAHAYEEWGPNCAQRFNGMFAFAIWDSRRQRLVLARDRLGIKPLFVYNGPDGVVFGSELKAVAIAPWVPIEWDLEAIDCFLTYEYVPAPRSVIAGIRKFPPACTGTFERGRPPAIQSYWRLQAGDPPTSPHQAAEQLRERLAVSVERRLLADVPVGAFLSGGIDSSTIVALATERSDAPVETFTLGFADTSYDERAHAKQVAHRFGTRHRERVVEPSAVQLAERLAWHLDEPFADVSAFPTYLISRHARDSVTVVLSGDGGDELLAGYDQYKAHRWASRLGWLTRSGSWNLVDRLLEEVPPGPKKKGAVNFAKRFAQGLRYPEDLEHARWWVFAGPGERRALYSAAMREALVDHDPLEHYRARLREGTTAGFTALQRQLYADLTGYLPDDILTKVDRMSMAVSLEARVPFLDHEVVEHAMTIPDAWKLRGSESKWILKQAMRGLLPAEVLKKSKQGFSMPMKNWLRGPLAPMLREFTSTERLRERGWFEPAAVQQMARQHMDGTANHAHQLWCLISLELSLTHLARLVAGRPRLPQEARL